MEMDAYAYAYAVMLYKYGREKISYLYLPKVYENDEFTDIINEWIQAFKEEGL